VSPSPGGSCPGPVWARPEPAATEDEKAIRALDEAYVRDYNRGDSKAVAGHFAEDASAGVHVEQRLQELVPVAGLGVDDVAPRVSFFWNAHNDFFEEIAKFRAARTLWAEIVRDEFCSTDRRSQMLRFHTHTGGSTLTA